MSNDEQEEPRPQTPGIPPEDDTLPGTQSPGNPTAPPEPGTQSPGNPTTIPDPPDTPSPGNPVPDEDEPR